MTTMIEEAMKMLKYVTDASTLDVIKIARDLKCSKRTVWRAKAKLEENNEKAVKVVTILTQNCQDIKWLLWMLLENSKLNTKNKASWQEKVYEVIDRLKEQCGDLELSLDAKGQHIEED